MEEKTKNILLLIGILYLVIGVLFYLGTAITGYVIYLQTNYTLGLVPENFVYNNSQIDISDGKIRLNEIINEYQEIKEEDKNYYISEAFSKDKDVKVDVISLDGNYINTKDLSVKFDNDVNNDDVARLYLRDVGHNNTIYLCSKELNCSEKNHGEIHYNDLVFENEMGENKYSWYNISVTNLQEPTNEFKLISDEPVKYDYIDAVHKEISVYNYSMISYSPEAELNSNEIILNGTIQAVLVDKVLNNGAVLNFYSVDNVNWIPFEDVINSNYSNIKLKLVFESNQNQTPEVDGIKLIYLLPTEEIPVNETNQTEQNTTVEIPAPSSGGGGGGGGGSSNRETPTEEIIIPEETKQEVYRIPAMQPQSEKKIIIGETEVPKPASNVPLLVGLTAKIVYSGKNIGSFLLGNWGWLILIILLLSAYIYLYLRRKKDRARKRKK